MTRARPVLALAALSVTGLAAAAPAQLASAIHVVTADNIACPPIHSCTVLLGTAWYRGAGPRRHLATANWNPGGGPGVYLQAPFANRFFAIGSGVYIAALIAPEDIEMPLGAAFNLLAVRGTPSCLDYHVATADNIVGNVTFLDRPALNGHPDAFVLVLHGGDPEPANLGVYYDSTRLQWGIFNEDLAAMVPLQYFTVYDDSCDVGLGDRYHLTCVGTLGNSCDLGTIGDGDPFARLLVTQRWDAGAPVYNPHPIGVYYVAGEWRVFNQDFAAMPAGAQFNVAEILVLLEDDFESADFSAWSTNRP